MAGVALKRVGQLLAVAIGLAFISLQVRRRRDWGRQRVGVEIILHNTFPSPSPADTPMQSLGHL